MAPVSAMLHRTGVRLRRYLDNWLIQASSREQVLLALETVLQLCGTLGIVVNWEKSQLIPTQRMVYLGVVLDSISFRASPALERVEKLFSIGDVFLSCVRQPVSSWLELLGVLSSMIQLVLGGRLRMRSFQFTLRKHWNHVDQSVLVEWTPEIRQDLDWWLDRDRLERGVSLEQVSPQLDLWSDASDVGWEAHLGEEVASGLLGSRGIRHFHQCQGALGNREGSSLVRSSNLRLLRSNFRRQRYGSSLSQESGRDTFVTSQFHRSEDSPLGGVVSSPAVSSAHHGKTQCSGGFVVSSESGPGLRVDSEAGGISGAAQEVAGFHRPVHHLSKSPLFSIFFSLPRSERSGNECSSQELVWVAGVCLSTLVAHSCGSEEAPVVLWGPADHHSSLLASEAMIPRSSGSGGGWSSGSASVQRPPSPTPLP